MTLEPCKKANNCKHGLMVHLCADDTQLYIKLCCKNLENIKVKMAACIHYIQSWCASMRLKLNATITELIWFDCRREWMTIQQNILILTLNAVCHHPMWFVTSVFS